VTSSSNSGIEDFTVASEFVQSSIEFDNFTLTDLDSNSSGDGWDGTEETPTVMSGMDFE